MIGLPWDSAARTSRRQFCAEGAAGEGEGSRPHSGYMNEHLALEVASREEDEDHLRAANVALQSADVVEIIHLGGYGEALGQDCRAPVYNPLAAHVQKHSDAW